MYEAAGQSVAWLHRAEPAATILRRLVEETGAALARLAPLVPRHGSDDASAVPTAAPVPPIAPDPPAPITHRRHRGDSR
jgi:hypothetical protein